MADAEDKLNFADGNRFYIYGDIDGSIPENIIAPMMRHIDEQSKLKHPQQIEVYISSDGGFLETAQAIITVFNYALLKGIKVNTHVVSHASSAASLIAVCGHYRTASNHATYLLHYPQADDYSHNEVMAERNLQQLKFLTKFVLETYEKYTKLRRIQKLLLADNYMVSGGEELKRLGFIDAIV